MTKTGHPCFTAASRRLTPTAVPTKTKRTNRSPRPLRHHRRPHPPAAPRRRPALQLRPKLRNRRHQSPRRRPRQLPTSKLRIRIVRGCAGESRMPPSTASPLLRSIPWTRRRAAAIVGGVKAGIAAASASAASAPRIVTIPAISDASGPDPRPYTYEMKPEEEAGYRSKMLDLATQLSAQAGSYDKRGRAQEIILWQIRAQILRQTAPGRHLTT